MTLKETLGKMFKKDGRFKELQEQFRMQKKLEEMQKNSNERELERFVEEDRQQKIKESLEDFRKKRQKEFFKNNILTKENTIKGGHEILKDKKIFSVKSTNLTGGNMFFN